MNWKRLVPAPLAICVVVITIAIAARAPVAAPDPNLIAFENATGQLRTLTTHGSIDFDNPFVEFYQTCFNIPLTARDKADLVAFLRSL